MCGWVQRTARLLAVLKVLHQCAEIVGSGLSLNSQEQPLDMHPPAIECSKPCQVTCHCSIRVVQQMHHRQPLLRAMVLASCVPAPLSLQHFT